MDNVWDVKLTVPQMTALMAWNTEKWGPVKINELVTYGMPEDEWAENQERYHGYDQSVTLNLFIKGYDVIREDEA